MLRTNGQCKKRLARVSALVLTFVYKLYQRYLGRIRNGCYQNRNQEGRCEEGSDQINQDRGSEKSCREESCSEEGRTEKSSACEEGRSEEEVVREARTAGALLREAASRKRPPLSPPDILWPTSRCAGSSGSPPISRSYSPFREG